MNILFLTYQGDIAGSTNSIIYLAKGLADHGHNVYMGCRKDALIYTALLNTKVKVVPMRFRGKLDLINSFYIIQLVKKLDIDIISAQSSYDRYTAGWAKLLGCSAKIVHTRRQMPLSDGFFFQKWFYNKTADAMVAVSNQVKIGLLEKGLDEKKLHVILNGTPKQKYELPNVTAKLEALRIRHNISELETIVGCISRRKQQDQLLQAMLLIKKKCTVMLVGIARDEALSIILDRQDFIHKVVFTGEIPPAEVLYYHHLMTVEVLPSTTEGLSQSLLEAMALGIPVIATNFAGNIDLIENGINGFLFENENYTDLSKKIELILENQEIRKSLISNGKETALVKFEISKVIRNYEVLFSKLIETSIK